MSAVVEMSQAVQFPIEGGLMASALFLMSEDVMSRHPLLAALVACELLAIERQLCDEPGPFEVVAHLRHGWWMLAQNGAEA